MKRMARVTQLIGLLALCFACEGEKSNKGYVFKTELKRLGAGVPGIRQNQLMNRVESSYAWTGDLTLESLTIPIVGIALGSSSENRTELVYTCDNDCTVDLMGPELTNLLNDKEIRTTGTGTFDQIWVSAINSGNSADLWEGKIRASFVLNGQTYYTKADDTLSLSAPAEDATFRYNGGRMDSFLPTPITLSGDQATPVSLAMQLFFDPLYIAFAIDSGKVSQGVTNSIGSGSWCIGSNGGVKLCVQRLQVTASTETVLPTRERYLVNDSGLLSLLIDSNNGILGGSFAPKFTENVLFKGFNGGTVSDIATENRTWATGSLATAKTNSDGTITLSNIYPEDVGTSSVAAGFIASQFQRASHSGTFRNSIQAEFPYTAVKL